jgi:hypothetical protein
MTPLVVRELIQQQVQKNKRILLVDDEHDVNLTTQGNISPRLIAFSPAHVVLKNIRYCIL